MTVDLSRDSFDKGKQFTRVLMQQGRVQLDADWNEQASILLHYVRALARDLIGPHGGPEAEPGFGITLEQSNDRITDLIIGPGRYYVDGVLCENYAKVDEEGNEVNVTYRGQPYYPLPWGEDDLPDLPFLVYLDVWERHVTTIEEPDIREVALGGPDTAARMKVVWQVRTEEISNEYDDGIGCANVRDYWDEWVAKWQPADRGKLKAKGRENLAEDTDPCVVSPEARYRGAENQLYRVEIHRPGTAQDDGSDDAPRRESTESASSDVSNEGIATFKWSRDNGSVVFPIRDLDGNTVTLEHLGRDDHQSLNVGDLVEIVDEYYVLQGRAETLLRVEEIDAASMRVVLSGELSSGVGGDSTKHPLLRRWDHEAGDSQDGAPGYDTLPLREGTWLTLEDGVQIFFELAQEEVQNVYRTGDYWLIPARTVTGDVEWPGDVGQPEARPPHGVEHHYAPLAIVSDGNVEDCRCEFKVLRECPPQSSNW